MNQQQRLDKAIELLDGGIKHKELMNTIKEWE